MNVDRQIATCPIALLRLRTAMLAGLSRALSGGKVDGLVLSEFLSIFVHFVEKI